MCYGLYSDSEVKERAAIELDVLIQAFTKNLKAWRKKYEDEGAGDTDAKEIQSTVIGGSVYKGEHDIRIPVSVLDCPLVVTYYPEMFAEDEPWELVCLIDSIEDAHSDLEKMFTEREHGTLLSELGREQDRFVSAAEWLSRTIGDNTDVTVLTD